MATSRATKGKRPRLIALSEEMRHRSGLLAQELLGWPDVRMRPMFGMRAFYRGTVVFAMLPGQRALESANAIASKDGGKWKHYELENDQDIGNALAILDKAYRKAAGPAH